MWVLIWYTVTGSIGMHDFTSKETCEAAAKKVIGILDEKIGGEVIVATRCVKK